MGNERNISELYENLYGEQFRQAYETFGGEAEAVRSLHEEEPDRSSLKETKEIYRN